uniref:Peptidase metallopeptidase domain-containing protein n=1 Tax=Oryza meridionalis TaxID=40149 RepID=A0A0E0ESB1_9ORYZ
MAKPGRDTTDAFDEHLELAVMWYQTRFSLSVTGWLDNVTLDRIMLPCCGVGDDEEERRPVSVALSPGQGGAIPVGFVGTDNYEAADIKVCFYAGDHGDGVPFDGPLGILSHAFSAKNGRLHLDTSEHWVWWTSTST